MGFVQERFDKWDAETGLFRTLQEMPRGNLVEAIVVARAHRHTESSSATEG